MGIVFDFLLLRLLGMLIDIFQRLLNKVEIYIQASCFRYAKKNCHGSLETATYCCCCGGLKAKVLSLLEGSIFYLKRTFAT